jgi:hypothetical protein
MAVFSAVDKEVTRNNTIIFSSISNDTLQIDQQFTRYNHLSYFIVGCLVLDGVCKLYAAFLCSESIRELYNNWVSYISVVTSLFYVLLYFTASRLRTTFLVSLFLTQIYN